MARARPALLPDARDLLLAFSFAAIDDDIVEGAMNEPDRGLRSRDAIHLATARVLREDLDAIVSYDDRVLKAGARGLTPGDPSGLWPCWKLLSGQEAARCSQAYPYCRSSAPVSALSVPMASRVVRGR